MICMVRVFVVFYAIMNLTCSCVHGQENGEYIKHQIDSLDKIKPSLYKNIKLTGSPYIINVRNQEQFEVIDADIKNAICHGRNNIKIIISKGIYHFKNNHIILGKREYDDVSIMIEGKNAIVTSDADYSEDLYRLSPWDELRFADGNIEVIDPEKKICLIPFKNDISNSAKSNYTEVQVTQWFKAPVYKVIKIDSRGIYFTAMEIKNINAFGRKEYTVNYDYLYSGKAPRFRLYNATKARNCTASTFIRIGGNTIRSFCIKGIDFRGNKAGTSLFEISNVNADQIAISDCRFDAIRGGVLSCVNTNNVLLEKCTIKNTMGNEVSFKRGCKNAQVIKNIFENSGQGLGNTLCIRCNESEYYIADNTFRDFGYCAIAVGVWYGHEKKSETSGIIEHNEICFSPQYIAKKYLHTLMDGGAIYVWTQNDDAIIRYNYVHDYIGMRSYSGIYCDDGASNCKIFGNVVLNTPSGCSILSHKVSDHKKEYRNNENNFMANNIVDGSIIFEGYDTENRHCVKGTNIRLSNKVKQQYSNRLQNLEISQKDIEVGNWSYKNRRLRVPGTIKNAIISAGVRK